MFRTLRGKFLVGFFLIFCLSFLLLNAIAQRVVETNNRKIVTEDLVGLKKNSSVYVRQAFLINHYANDEIYFGQMAEEMAQDLRHATGAEVGAYSLSGQLLYASDRKSFEGAASDDLNQALVGRTAYTITYGNGQAYARYSYPVVIDGAKVGILRFDKDFSLVYGQSERLLSLLFDVALGVFAAAFLFTYLLSRHITIPVVRLTKASAEVTEGNLEVRIPPGRKDEIGRLGDHFNAMIGQIKRQISRIEQDRDRLGELNVQRKRFFDNMTHELKTPLTSILGYAELIRENGEKDRAFFEKGMKHIVEESQRLHALVSDLLETSKAEAAIGTPEVVEAAGLLAEVCEAMNLKAARYHKTVRCDAEGRLPVRGRPDRLRQLFINLLDNAIKYGEPQSEIAVSALSENGGALFAFANRGETVPPEVLARIFEPYYREHEEPAEAGSVGLGLGICREIVRELEGTIDIFSDNERTTVRVWLPAADEGKETSR
ncbi:sensor histidine kinase [Cohnella zeiphila]|uniref:histidine kinase n=1 Tax=Cohnella zeiphila TaxID=2761120 RepID=A0A7X0SUV3_9BACL|nr:HAMP domain-containing sensor histidine kinase [Cohnella zeiphila]MBB6734283.1 HAMP domain-containing histidine kinase [Cohnella zeiphila]